eukprot:3824844-Rhodomonas_salina.1
MHSFLVQIYPKHTRFRGKSAENTLASGTNRPKTRILAVEIYRKRTVGLSTEAKLASLQVAIVLRACYAMSGTDVAYAATRAYWMMLWPRSSVCCCAIRLHAAYGTDADIAYAAPLCSYTLATRSPVLT